MKKKIVQNKKEVSMTILEKLFNPSKFSKWVREYQKGKDKFTKYSDIVRKECHNSVFWMTRELYFKDIDLTNFSIVLGLWDNKDHSWLRFKNFYIDLTIKQFNNNLDKLYITLERDAKKNLYAPLIEYKLSSKIELEMFYNRVGGFR